MQGTAILSAEFHLTNTTVNEDYKNYHGPVLYFTASPLDGSAYIWAGHS